MINAGSLKKAIVITSIIWLTVFFFAGGYYRNAYRISERLYKNITKENRQGQTDAGAASLAVVGEPFAAALKSMYERKPQRGTDGVLHEIDGATRINMDEGLWMHELCRKIKPGRTMEIGFAYGFSTVYFLAALKANGMGVHVAMDPFEHTEWHGIGLQKVHDLGMDGSFRFMEEYDVTGIPALIREGLKYEVIFIDGNHRFDDVLIDFTLADYVCADGGFIILDDLWMPAIQKAAAFIASNRADYQIQATPVKNIKVFKKVSADKREFNHFINF
jgi:predicted O-methyltransferase YrrM